MLDLKHNLWIIRRRHTATKPNDLVIRLPKKRSDEKKRIISKTWISHIEKLQVKNSFKMTNVEFWVKRQRNIA